MGVLGVGHVLVIGDAPAVVNRLRAELQAEGLMVTGVLGEIEGERRTLGDDVALIVLDRMVPWHDGLDMLRLVHQRRRALPIIVLSARAEVADRVAAFDAGATDFLAKPFSPSELVARVHAQLRRAAWAGPDWLGGSDQ
jgi:DNA-binding response OmpR family regulator